MKLVIFGPPGSGKGTYSTRIAPVLKIARIATGDMFREEVKNNTQLGKLAAMYMNKGEFVPDDVTMKMFKERLKKPDTKNGFILDGFPRTIFQAKELEKITKIELIINLIVPDEILIEKMSARRMCRKCGDIYNIADIKKTIEGVDYILPPMLPKKKNVCDKCGGELYQRDDDKPEVIKERLEVYKKQAAPVIEHYKGTVPFIDVHVTRGPEIMVNKILDEMKKINFK